MAYNVAVDVGGGTFTDVLVSDEWLSKSSANLKG